MKYALSAELIGTVREVSIEPVPGFLLRAIRWKSRALTYRGDGTAWYSYPSGKRVEDRMVPFLNNVWTELGPKENVSRRAA
jgi:hypothetical protein